VTSPGKELDRAVDFAKKIAFAAPLGIRATLASAHRALAEGETAAFAALLPDFAKLFRSEDFQERRCDHDRRRASGPVQMWSDALP
jgi:enoyl-CoA hydratase/carnithine racemase